MTNGHSSHPLPSARGATVLVADDDTVSRDMLALLLRSADFVVETATDGQEALEIVRRRANQPFAAVFSDIEMPRLGGFDLLSLLNTESPATATVIVTGNRERELVSASLRGGAVEFLDKPFSLPAVLRAAHRALGTHLERRRQLAAQRRLGEVADIHHRLNRSSFLEQAGLPARLALHTRFHALHEAGGDLVKLLVLPPDRVLLVLGDVSGHGLKEGFLAAYFQGVLQGMGRQAADARTMAEAFNDFLQTHSNESSPLALNTSLDASFLELDLSRRRLSTLECGGTGARLVLPDGALHTLPAGGAPLGWFPRLHAAESSTALPPSGQCWLWSDGLEEQAAKLGVPPLALAWRLVLSPEDQPPAEVLAHATDDIVACRLDWAAVSSAPPSGLPWSPLHEEILPGDSSPRIDSLHAAWETLLALALPRAGEALVHDVALCAREATLNALQHGCGDDPARHTRVAFLLDPPAAHLLLRVADDGPGFDPAAPPPAREPGHVSLGLGLIRALASSVSHSADGRVIEAVFPLPASP